MRTNLLFALFLVLSVSLVAQTGEQNTARYLYSIRQQPPLLLAFLHQMPKGADLHNHLDGAVYAEDLIDFAASDNLCVERATSKLVTPPCDACEQYEKARRAVCLRGSRPLQPSDRCLVNA